MTSGGLLLHDVVKRYSTGENAVSAVDGVTLDVAPGEMVALCGPSGSGKSTLLLLAAGLLSPDEGSVFFGETDVSALSANGAIDYQRRDVGLVSQSVDLFPGVPAVENAAMKLLADRVPLGAARRAVVPWLDRLGLGDRLDHTPDRLSAGERARVAIARALVNRPRVILADEPTASLDTDGGRRVAELLAAVGREEGATVLLVTHDPKVATVADRVEALRDGRLIARGPAAAPTVAIG
jgi:putative ABC transport system ATP-binding protein